MIMAATGGHFHMRSGAGAIDPRCSEMRTALCALMLTLTGCSTQSTWVQPSAAPLRPVAVSTELLTAHNRERAMARVQPIAWDESLAVAAASYARQLASSGTLRHSRRETRPDQGENLWMGTRGAYSPAQMVGNWASEKRYFRPGVFPAVSSTGNWADVGHYSQMIWPTTARLGCAIASNASADFLVCRYAPAGNIDGRRVP